MLGDGLELHGASQQRGVEALHRHPAPREVAVGGAHAAHVKAFQRHRLQAVGDDAFGAATANVDDEAAPSNTRQSERYAQVNEARFFDAGDNFDVVAQRCFSTGQKATRALGLAQRVRAHHAHPAGLHFAQALAEALEARQRAALHYRVEATIVGEAIGEAHHFTQAVHDDELAVRVPRHDHVERIGAEIDSRQNRRHPALARSHLKR